MKLEVLKKEELIGRFVTIIKSKNSSYENIEGKIVDETRHNFQIMLPSGKKMVIFKRSSLFAIENNGKKVVIDGSHIQRRSEERIKVMIKNE